MFDLTRITEMVGGLLGQQSGTVGDIMAQLSQLNIDPALLDGVNPAEAMSLLAEHGIDLNQLDPSQLSTLLEQFAPNSPIAEALTGLLSQRTGSS